MAKSKRAGGGRSPARRPGWVIPPGWIGGFAQSNPKFAYDPKHPKQPDLSSLPLLGNMDNIDKLQRQQKVLWPEFSWQTVPDHEWSRCFQMFSPDISRVGYTDEGRVYSIICPQQGVCHRHWGCLNVEVTVTGNRGWVDEKPPTNNIAADLTTQAQIWFTPSSTQSGWVHLLWNVFAAKGLKFPASKEDAIQVTLWNSENSSLKILPGRWGESKRFQAPPFARHPDQAWNVANLEVYIGPILKIGNPMVDDFNQLVMDAFNIASGNLLAPGSILSWNVWMEQPTLVDQQEWRDHAEVWRKSIDKDHGAPTGPGTKPRFADGAYFHPAEAAIAEAVYAIIAFLEKHL